MKGRINNVVLLFVILIKVYPQSWIRKISKNPKHYPQFVNDQPGKAIGNNVKK